MKNNLLIIPSVPIWKQGGELYFDRKFHDGIVLYCNNWQGSVSLLMRVSESAPPDFGLIQLDKTVFPATVLVIKQEEKITRHHLKQASVVLASGDNHKNLNVSKICQQLDIKCVYIIENILETRFQIINMSGVGVWQKIKSSVWTVLIELKRRRAFSAASGIQANGVPAYSVYKKITSHAVLYFDSRNSTEMSISETDLVKRLDYLDRDKPIRLGFSGRLIAMKGADHLIDLALILRKKSIPFSLSIFGAGDLSEELEKKVKEFKLEECVWLRGNVDFSKELVPFIKEYLDLFICCHRQSDPSCTYLETYACGVPILGYANKAHQGILGIANVGWSVPMNDINALASKVEILSKHRKELKVKAKRAVLFATEHTFDQTFKRRIEQCRVIEPYK
mgnify:CR=1 FL=1